jgi:hypothetical protein
MLAITEEFYGTDDIAAIKTWLSQSGAGLFRKAIQQEIYKLQIEASNDMIAGMAPDKARFKEDAEAKLRRVKELQVVMAELDKAASVNFKPFVAKVNSV